MEAQNSLINNLKKELSEEKIKNELLTKETNEMKNEIKKLEISANTAKGENSKLKEELISREYNITKKEKENNELKHKNDESQTVIGLLKNRISSLEIKISEDFEREHKRQKEESLKNEKLIKNLEEKNNEQVKRRVDAEEELDGLRLKIKTEEEEYTNLKCSLENRILLKENEIMQFKKEIENYKSEIEISKSKNLELGKENEDNKCIIERLNQTLYSKENDLQRNTKEYIDKLKEKDIDFEKVTNLKNIEYSKLEEKLEILKKENTKYLEKSEYLSNEIIHLKKDIEDKDNQYSILKTFSSNQIKDLESKLNTKNTEKENIISSDLLNHEDKIKDEDLKIKYENIVNQFQSLQLKNCELLKSLELHEELLKKNNEKIIVIEDQIRELTLEKESLSKKVLNEEIKADNISKLLEEKQKIINELKLELQKDQNKLNEFREIFQKEKSELIYEILRVNKTLITLCQESIDEKLNKVENINKISKMLNDLNESNNMESRIQILNGQKHLIHFLKLIKITKDIAAPLTNITKTYIENKQSRIMIHKNEFERLYQIQDNAKLKCQEYEKKLN